MSALAKITKPLGVFDGPYYLSIAGKLLESKDSFDVVNPATGHVLAKAPSATPEQLEEAIAGAKAALTFWLPNGSRTKVQGNQMMVARHCMPG